MIRNLSMYYILTFVEDNDFPLTSVDELNLLMDQGENTQVEFKAELSDEVLRELPTRLAALANSQGGSIIFGLANNKDPKGLVLKGDERDRISQCASNCSPVITLERIEEIRFGNRVFILVRVRKSKVVHCDSQRKFPVRIGTITGYLDTFGLVALLQERGIIRIENLEQQHLQTTSVSMVKRELVSENSARMLAKSLNSKDIAIRLEGLRDLLALQYQRSSLQNEEIADAIGRILSSRNEDQIRIALDVLRNAVLWGSPEERKIARAWVNSVFELGNETTSPELVRAAFNMLMYSGNSGAVKLLVKWVTSLDDTVWNTLQPANMIRDMYAYGLKDRAKEEMYGILEEEKNDGIRKKASAVLETLRQTPP